MSIAPLRIEEPGRAPPRWRLALFNLGFRPFYLLAALFSALAIAAWVAAFAGGPWSGHLPAMLWHQHEMLFGFALAVVSGFLLTAGRVWTGRGTPEGWPLALLALHWITARALVFSGPPLAALLVDGSFPFVVAAVMARAIFGAGNRRNYFVVVLLCALGVANIAFHLEPGETPVRAGLWLVITLVVVMAGRVVPAFTASALPRAGVRLRPALDRVAIGASVVAFAADLLSLGAWIVAPSALAAAALHTVRQWGWAPWATRQRPILWILHLSHAWLPVGFALLALETMGAVNDSVPLHAFGAGALGGMIIAMITRTALGHTGRPLVAGGAEITAYLLIHAAAALRVAASLWLNTQYLSWIAVSGALWCAGFLVYFFSYAPRLASPRIDGKPG